MKQLCSFILVLLLVIVSCSKNKNTQNDHSYGIASKDTPAMDFWKNVDFRKIDFSNPSEHDERMFLEYLRILSAADENVARKSIFNFFDIINQKNKPAFQYYKTQFEKYLYNPNSPIRNDALYSLVLSYLVHSPDINETEKMQYKYQLSMISKNNVGEQAADFEFISKGKKEKLYNIKSEYTILFFNDPECYDCIRTKKILSEINNPNIKIVSIFTDKKLVVWQNTVYPDSWISGYNNTTIHKLYDLKAIPSLYLLDKDKRVLLKDANVESILNY